MFFYKNYPRRRTIRYRGQICFKYSAYNLLEAHIAFHALKNCRGCESEFLVKNLVGG